MRSGPVKAANMFPISLSWLRRMRKWKKKEDCGGCTFHLLARLRSSTHVYPTFDWTNAQEADSTTFKSIRGWISFSWMNISAVLFVQQQIHGATPQAESNLGIMISGMFVHFAHSALITALRSRSLHLLKIDTFCNILLIHIVSFESLWVSVQTKKARRTAYSRPAAFSLN